MAVFEKWWNDPKKHKKRRDHWLPHLKGLANKLNGSRALRYFTLCARPMIDVFMLVREGILPTDPENGALDSIRFCECDPEHFSEINEMIGREDAGYFGRLEDVILFEDDALTGACPTRDSIATRLENEGLPDESRERLQLKRTFMDVQDSFPYDYINLDFCDYYYQAPPNMLSINQTVERILDWQRRPSDDGAVEINEFLLAVTCRHDAQFPDAATERLGALLEENWRKSEPYRNAIVATRGVKNVKEWAGADKEDFFFAGWPKDIAAAARTRHWETEILDYCYYRREDGGGNRYLITCVVLKFTRKPNLPDYLQAALHALDKDSRKFIDEIDTASADGKALVADLKGIVQVRNARAKFVRRDELPNP